jgi:transketolase
MALEDLASFRAITGTTVLYPCDATSTAKLVALMGDLEGITFLRTTRGATPVIYGPDETFEAGGSKVIRASDNDAVTVVAAGITVPEALKAAEALATEGIEVRVVDLYSVKPVDGVTLRAAAEATDGRIVTVEDHAPEGGVGDAVLDALAGAGLKLTVTKLAVREIPGSGKPEELLAGAGIDANAIADAVRALAKS